LVLLAAPAEGQMPGGPVSTNAPSSAPVGLIDDLKLRAAKGDADAEQKLGMAYYDGQLVPKDEAQAFALVLMEPSETKSGSDSMFASIFPTRKSSCARIPTSPIPLSMPRPACM